MEEPSEIENWKRISVLGSGAFGVVSLWQNQATDEYIAIKKCKFKIYGGISEKQRKRWENEVNIMKTLNCINIVSFKPLPKQLEIVLLKYNPTKLPLLSMEYCKKGNLRHVLNQAKNSSGLEENEVRTVLKDLTAAVYYLHSFKVTHRDIKPENIVLQISDTRKGGIIYKLIDLGYAKELNDSVVSFVGTLHYLAPEIIKTETYNHSVDYWSLGIVTFEIICGVLPFLPQYTPFQRFQYIERKEPDTICIYQLYSGSIAHSSELLKENHITTCLKQNIEIWLRHALQFNPSLRSANFPNNANIFNYLLDVLNKKIISVFCVHTLEFYSYEINDGTLISTLKDWIMRDTKVQKNEQVLLTNAEMFDVTDDKYVINTLSEDDFDVFVFKKGAFINRDTFSLPKYVKVLFENCTKSYEWRELRPIYTKSLFFLSQERKMITSLLTAFKHYTCYICNLNIKLKATMKEIYKDLKILMLKVDCYNNLRNNLCGFNIEKNYEYKQVLMNFQRLMSSLERCIITTNRLVKKVTVLTKRQVVLDKLLSNVTPIIQNCDMNTCVMKAADLLSRGGEQGHNLSSREMVKIVSNGLKEKDKLLNNKNFQNYAKAMSVAVKDVGILLDWMGGYHIYIKELTSAIDINQKEQYRILLSSVKPKSIKLMNGYVYLDAESVLNENQELRYKFEETIGQMFLDHKNSCDEIKNFLSQKL